MADVATVLWTEFAEVRRRRPALARPRPLRALGRPRLDAALQPAASDRLRRHDDGRDQELPAVGLADPRPPGVRPHARRRDHHRAAGPGPRHRGRHGDGRAQPRGPLRRAAGRPPHLGDRRRRLPDGGRQPRGRAPGRPAEARQADRALRRQRHHHRRPRHSGRDRRPDRCASRRPAGRRSGSTGTTTARSSGALRWAQSPGPAELHRLQDADQQGRRAAWKATSTATATPCSTRRSPRRARRWAGPAPPFEIPDDVAKAWRKAGRARPRRAQALGGPAEGTRAPRRLRAGDRAATCRTTAFAALDEHIAKAAAERPAAATRVHSGAALEVLIPAIPEMIGGSADLTGSNNTIVKGMTAFDAPGLRPPLRPLRRARARHGRGDERHGRARRRDPLLGHLPGVRRLQPRGDPAGRADGRAGDPRDDPRLDRPRRRRSDPPAGRAPGRRCGRCRTCWSSAPPTRWRPPNAGRRRCMERRTPSVHGPVAPEDRGGAHAAAATSALRGAYELAPADGPAKATIFASGTEVAVAMAARALLKAEGVAARVVSTPCWELFERQDAALPRPGDRPRAGPRGGRGGGAPGLGALHRRGRRLRRHDRLRRLAPPPSGSTRSSASPPKR